MAAAAKMMCSGWHLQMWEFRLITWVNTRETETEGCTGIVDVGLRVHLLSLCGATSDNSRTWNCIFHSALSSCIRRWYRHRRLHDAFYRMVDVKAVFFVPQKLQQEVSHWQKRVDALNEMAQKLVAEYNSDDTSKVKDTIAQMNNRWQQFKSR